MKKINVSIKQNNPAPLDKNFVPLWHKTTLTVEEAEIYSGIGKAKIREISNSDDCSFVLWNGNKRLIKRKLFDEYLEKTFSL